MQESRPRSPPRSWHAARICAAHVREVTCQVQCDLRLARRSIDRKARVRTRTNPAAIAGHCRSCRRGKAAGMDEPGEGTRAYAFPSKRQDHVLGGHAMSDPGCRSISGGRSVERRRRNCGCRCNVAARRYDILVSRIQRARCHSSGRHHNCLPSSHVLSGYHRSAKALNPCRKSHAQGNPVNRVSPDG